jgi:hypothetical protein
MPAGRPQIGKKPTQLNLYVEESTTTKVHAIAKVQAQTVLLVNHILDY